MVPHYDFKLVIAGNYFTDKRKMADKPFAEEAHIGGSAQFPCNFSMSAGGAQNEGCAFDKTKLTIFSEINT